MNQPAPPDSALPDPTTRTPPRQISLAAAMLLVAIVSAVVSFTDLGDSRVLTRHEVLAAEPAREMTLFPSFQMFMLPKLAGTFRTAKPPGMMWVIAASITAFGHASALAARFPSGLACVASAVLLTALAARWFDIAVATLAGLFQATLLITQMQGRLCEADATLGVIVFVAIGSLALACVDSRRGRASIGWTSLLFYIAVAASFMFKGLIGPGFALFTALAYWYVSRDSRVLRFLLNPWGIAIFLCTMLGWVAIAYRIDPAILHDWFNEQVGTATGTFGSDPWYFYFHSVPFDLLPWTPLFFVGLIMGIPLRNDGQPATASAATASALSVPVLDYVTPSAIATDVRGRFRRWTQRYDPITQFLACWFMPGIVFLSLIKHKHAHYPIPILPPLIITTAAGMVHFIRWRRRNPPPMTLVLIWTAVCLFVGAVGAHFVLHLSKIPTDDLRHDLAILVGVITAACIGSSLLENRRWNIAQTACIILCTVIVEISLQCTVVPALDEYRPQAELAQRAAAEVPADKTIYLLGRREEEHEAQYAYYLREPMQRCDEFTLFPSFVATNPPPLYAIVPNILIPDLQARWKVTVLDQTSTVRPGETEDDHLKLVRLEIAASN